MAVGQAPLRNVVKIAIERFGPEHEAAADAFNRRMRDARAPSEFLLPTRFAPPVRSGSVTLTNYVAVAEDGSIRGGVLCQEHPALAGTSTERTVNLQAPLSEGIVDPAYAFVGPQLIKHVLRLTPFAFAVGMGDRARPLPRLLEALGWKVRAVPFYFRLLRPSRCARQLAPLRTGPVRRLAGALAAATGVAAAAAAIVHRPSAEIRRAASRFEVDPIDGWAEWADVAWDVWQGSLSFGVRRATDTLPFFYPGGDRRLRAWALTRGGVVEGWFGLLVAQMRENPYFGDLTVATLTDCVGTPEAVRAAAALSETLARSQEADLIVTNQQHRWVRNSCAAAGWRQGPSNYLFATSRALTARIDEASVYVTRRDGDGIGHLGG